MEDLEQRARRIIDANKYLTLATVDAAGSPWATPAFYTPDGYSTFYWASSPDSRHSRNVTEQPDIAIVVFDSSVPIGGAEAVYVRARASVVRAEDLADRAAFYCDRYPETRSFKSELLRPDSPFDLYRVDVSEHSVLVRGSDPTYGTGVDSRAPVVLD